MLFRANPFWGHLHQRANELSDVAFDPVDGRAVDYAGAEQRAAPARDGVRLAAAVTQVMDALSACYDAR